MDYNPRPHVCVCVCVFVYGMISQNIVSETRRSTSHRNSFKTQLLRDLKTTPAVFVFIF